MVITLPLLEQWGWYDHWPAWGLYASHRERVGWWIRADARERLPVELREFTQPDPARPGWERVNFERWILDRTAAPAYPQGRYLLAVVRALQANSSLQEHDAYVVWFGPAQRWTGRRREVHLRTSAAIQQQLRHSWWNTMPRG